MAIKFIEEPLPPVEMIDFKINGWYGINKNNADYRFGDLKNCRNMSGEAFPYASPRQSKEVVKSGIENPQRIFSNNGVIGYIANGNFYYGEDEHNNKGVCGDTSAIVVYDDKIYTFPSNCCYDVDKETLEGIEGMNLNIFLNGQAYNQTFSIYDRTRTGRVDFIHSTYFSIEDIEEYENKKTLSVNYSGIAPDGIWVRFKINNSDWHNGDYAIMKNRNDGNLYFEIPKQDGTYANLASISLAYYNYSDGSGNYSTNNSTRARCNTDYGKITDSKCKVWLDSAVYPSPSTLPVIDYACEYNNRIVGIQGNNVYASSLGNMSDWTTFNTETGAYASDVGTLGDFTGIANFQNMVFMFKPDMVHQLYGNQLPFYIRDGFKVGCVDGKTICEVNGSLYWLGREGLYEYSGGQPRLISEDVFDGYENGTACTDGRFYYICLNNNAKYETYIFDTYKRLWHRYDEEEIIDMTYCDGHVYALSKGGDIIKFNSGTERVAWMFETHDMNFGTKTRKNVSKLWIRASMKPQTMLNVFIRGDGGEYKQAAHYISDKEAMFDFKVRIKKADSFSLKFEGLGEVKILDVHAKVTVGTSKHRVGGALDTFR